MGTFNLLTIDHGRPAIEAFKILNAKALSAMPVVDDEGKMVRDLRSVEIFSIAIHAYLSHRFFSVTDLKSLVGNVTKLLHDPLKDWISEKNSVVSVSQEATIGTIMKTLNQNRVHRVYICEKEKPLGQLSFTLFLRSPPRCRSHTF